MLFRSMLVMATGTGKTVVFAKLYEKMRSRLPGQMMVIAHTEELVKQNAKKLQAANPTAKVGIEMAGLKTESFGCDIISASVQTLGRKDGKRAEKITWENVDKLVIDESHHSCTDGYKRIFELAGCLSDTTHKLLLGVTATPTRPDGIALSEIYEKIVFQYPIRQAIKEKYLIDIRGYRVRTNTTLDGVSRLSGDFVKGDLSKRVNTPLRNQQVVEAWKKVGVNRRTLVFTVDIQHAQDLAEEFRGIGIKAEAIWGDDPDREGKLGRHRDGTTLVLCNCNLLTEGYDDPDIACVVLARPTQSPILFSQMVGRGARLADGKVNLIVLDVVDGTAQHSLITLPTLMGLGNNLDLHGGSLLEIAEAVESMQELHPNVDFSKLDDILKAGILIESVNMFQVRFPKEVEENSELIWFRAATGGYKMLVPKETDKTGKLHVYENALGQWELDGVINGDPFHGIRPSFEEIIKVSDEQIRKRVTKKTLSMVKREAKWHGNHVSDPQKNILERLFPPKHFDFDLMKSGDASRMIAQRLTRGK